MNNSLISIITPMYNSEKFLKQTIDSVRNQTYDKWEMIIIDDFSTDSSVDIAKKEAKKDSRIKLFQFKKNLGPAVARNLGIIKAKGKFIAFLDSDDLWKRNKLERQIEFMENYDYAFTYTPYEVINENGDAIKVKKSIYRVDYKTMLKRNYIGNSTVLLNKAYLGDFFVPLIKKRNDYALWLLLLKKISYAYCFNVCLSYYRVRKNSVSNNKIKAFGYNYELFNKIEGFNKVTSFFFTLRNSFYKIFDSTIN